VAQINVTLSHTQINVTLTPPLLPPLQSRRPETPPSPSLLVEVVVAQTQAQTLGDLRLRVVVVAEEEQQRMESKLLALLKDTGEEHSQELTTAAAELEAIRDEHAVQLVQHHAAAEAAQASLKEKLLALAVEEKAALHASALSNAAEELARFREEHAEELQHQEQV
jgi:hypothetical protein